MSYSYEGGVQSAVHLERKVWEDYTQKCNWKKVEELLH